MNKNVIDLTAAEGVRTEAQEGDITTAEKVYTFRKLEATDVFLMFKILGKIGINEFAECFGKDSVQKMFSTLTGEKAVANFTQTMGIAITLEVVNVVLGNLPKCEQEIFQMLSNTSNLTVDQVKKLDFPTFTAMVIDFVKKDEFKDFIKVVSVLFK
jgi:hypothetical protein